MGTSLAHALISRNSSRSTIHWLQSVPTPLEEKNLGTLFGILEIESSDSRNDEILNAIGEELHGALYSSEHFSTEAAFEVALQKTNKKIQEMTRASGEEWLRQFNAIIGVVSGTHVYFTSVGSGVALLLYKEKITELLDHTKAKLEVINPVKVFQDTIAGDIQGDTRIFFSTETIYDYFSQEKIRRLLIEGTAEEVALHIERSLDETLNTSLACAVITPQNDTVAVHTEHTNTESATTKTDDDDSMSRLLDKEYQTSQTLSGSLWANVKSSLQKNARNQGEKHTGALILGRVIEALMFIGSIIVKTTRSLVVSIARLLSRTSKNTYSPRLSARTTRSSFQHRMKEVFQNIWKWFLRLTAIQKTFVIIASTVCIIVLSGIFNQKNQNTTKEKTQEYTAILSQVDVKINDAKAAMLYDKNRARTILNEAKTAVQSIPSDATEFAQSIAEHMQAISEQLLIANGVKVLGALDPVLQFSPVATSVSVSHITLLGSSIYAFDASGGRVYRGNLDTKQSTVVIDRGDQSVTAASQASVGTALVVLSSQTLGILKPVSESIQSITTEFPKTDVNIADARIFASRLYTLDSKNGQIYKHAKNTELNFAKGTAWITDSTNISNAVSFAIDGSIYVLQSSGQAAKFTGGKKDAWQLSAIDPALSSVGKIVTDENTSKLYILDSANSRIAVFGKDGSVSTQYQSSVFSKAKDMIVDEAKKTLYVLSENSVYTVTIE